MTAFGASNLDSIIRHPTSVSKRNKNTVNNSSSTANSSSLHFHTGKVRLVLKIKLNSVLLPKREILLFHLYELGTKILVVHKVEELTVQIPAGKPSAYTQLPDPSNEVKKEKLHLVCVQHPKAPHKYDTTLPFFRLVIFSTLNAVSKRYFYMEH